MLLDAVPLVCPGHSVEFPETRRSRFNDFGILWVLGSVLVDGTGACTTNHLLFLRLITTCLGHFDFCKYSCARKLHNLF